MLTFSPVFVIYPRIQLIREWGDGLSTKRLENKQKYASKLLTEQTENLPSISNKMASTESTDHHIIILATVLLVSSILTVDILLSVEPKELSGWTPESNSYIVLII